MKTVALFGAGKSAGALIDFLKSEADQHQFSIILADADAALLHSKAGGHARIETHAIDITDTNARRMLITRAQVVISLMPPSLHLLIAKDCLLLHKHLLTASYVSADMEKLSAEIADKKLLFLCEMGLDPGIDHMSAMQMIHDIETRGGEVHTFKSWCGGLVAPESDDNPWHYKFSWNPKNVINAGKDGAVYLTNGEVETVAYEQLFANAAELTIPEATLASYPNRNSLDYIARYGLKQVQHFERSTLRHPHFMTGWHQLVSLQFTSDEKVYTLRDNTIGDFFRMHFERVHFGDWLDKRVGSLQEAKVLMKKLLEVMKSQEIDMQNGGKVRDFLTVDERGQLHLVNIEEAKVSAAEQVAESMGNTKLFFRQLDFLGWNEETVKVPDGEYSAADMLLWLMERKMMLRPEDKDWVVMVHEIGYRLKGKEYIRKATMSLKGKPGGKTAMASTVGLPLGIAAVLLLQDLLPVRGLKIPVEPAIYEPVLTRLAEMGITFSEEEMQKK